MGPKKYTLTTLSPLTEKQKNQWEKISYFSQLDLEYAKHEFVCEDCREKHAFFEHSIPRGLIEVRYLCKGKSKIFSFNGQVLLDL